MQIRNLLVIAFHFPPLSSSATFRTLDFVRYLTPLGWRAMVVTVRDTDAYPHDEALLAKVPPGTRIVRAPWVDMVAHVRRLIRWMVTPLTTMVHKAKPQPTLQPSRQADPEQVLQQSSEQAPARSGFADAVTRFLQTPDRQAVWIITATAAGLRTALSGPRPSVVLASGPPMSGLVAGALLSRLIRVPLVSDFRDPWVGNPFRNLPYRWLRSWDRALERFVVQSSSVCLLNTAPVRDDFTTRYSNLPKDRFVVLENGFDPSEFPGVPSAAERQNECLTLLHAGALYGQRDPTPFLRAVRQLLEANPSLRGGKLAIRFIGFQDDPRFTGETLRSVVEKTSTLLVEGSLPHRETLVEMARSDVLLLLGVSGTGPEMQIPAKLFEYLASGRPILALCHPNGAIASVLRESTARYWLARPDDEETQVRILQQVVEVHRRGELGRGPSSLPARFDRKRQAEQLDVILRSVCR